MKNMPPVPEIDGISWCSMTCAACGQEILYGIDSDVPAEDQAFAMELIFGTPPVHTECQRSARLAA
jgi:hypothetical protein